MTTRPPFEAQLVVSGSDVIYHREDDGQYRCPCVTIHGDRDAELHFRQRNGWFYIDGSATIGAAGNPSGSFQYGVAPLLDGIPLGIPYHFASAAPVNQRVTLSVDTIDGRFPSVGRSEPVALVIYRRSSPTGQWREVGQVAPGATLEDNFADLSASALAPPECNERGWVVLPGDEIELSVKAFVQPIQSTRATRLTSEYLVQLWGEVEADDHLGIFPLEWAGVTLYFHEWSDSGEDFIVYRGRRFFVVNANEIPDPSNGLPHHWEVGLRLVRDRG